MTTSASEPECSPSPGSTWIRREFQMISAKMAENRGFARILFAAVGQFHTCRLSPPEVSAYGLDGVFSLPMLESGASWLTVEEVGCPAV